MSINELYQEMILEHNKKPRNFHKLADANRKAEGFNPLCGDKLTLYLQVDGDTIRDIGFLGSGCAISKASASMMTTLVKGKKVEEANELIQKFRQMLSRDSEAPFDEESMGKLAVFSGVSEFPARVKCATLAWHTLASGLEGKQAHTVTTEEDNR